MISDTVERNFRKPETGDSLPKPVSPLRPGSHSVFGRWHPEREGRAVPGRRRHRDVAVVRLGNLADQREPDPVGLAPARLVCSPPCENRANSVGKVCGSMPTPSSATATLTLLAVAAYPELDRSAVMLMCERVVDQRGQRSAQRRFRPDHLERPIVGLIALETYCHT